MRFTNFLEEKTGQFLKNAQKIYDVWDITLTLNSQTGYEFFSSCLWNPSKVPTFSAFGQRAKIWRSWFIDWKAVKKSRPKWHRNGFFHGFQWKTSPLVRFFTGLPMSYHLISFTFQRILGKMGPSGGHLFGEVIPCNYQGILLIGFLSPLWGSWPSPTKKTSWRRNIPNLCGCLTPKT